MSKACDESGEHVAAMLRNQWVSIGHFQTSLFLSGQTETQALSFWTEMVTFPKYLHFRVSKHQSRVEKGRLCVLQWKTRKDSWDKSESDSMNLLNQPSPPPQSHQTGGQMLTNNPRFKWGLHWRQTANQPAAVEARVSSLHCPSPFSPTALFHRQNPFQAALLCSKHSALCAMGEGSPAGRETAIAVTATAARAPFWKGYVLTNILMSSWLKCIITYYVQGVQFLLSCQTK